MTVYVLIYDADNGSREDCNIFYSPIEVFADAATRQRRIDYVEKMSCYDIGFRTEDLEPNTTHDFEMYWGHVSHPDDTVDQDDDADDRDDDFDPDTYTPSTDPTKYLFYVSQEESPWNGQTGEDDMSTMVAICPEDYFRKTGYQWDQHTELDLPDTINEVTEGFFEYEGTVEEARAELLALGLKEDTDYAKFMKAHSQSDDADDDVATVQTVQTIAPHMPPEELVEEDDFKYGNNSWLTVDPTEYYFYVTLGKDPDGLRTTVAYLVPVRYWETNRTVCDQQVRIDLPDGFASIGVNVYSFDESPSAARMELRGMGMREDLEFNDVIRTLSN